MPFSLWECVCEMASQSTPSVADVLKQLNQHTECTNTQCFDEIVPMHMPTSPALDAILFMGALVLAASALAMMRPARSEEQK